MGVDGAPTLAAAILFVLVFEAEVAKPFRIPSSSMEHDAGTTFAKNQGGW